MKKIYGIAFASAALMLASCSNESEPGGPNVNEPGGSNKYLTVNICTPGDTRADSDYEIGSENENKVTKMRFVILKKGAADTEYSVSYSYLVNDNIEQSDPGNYPSTVERLVKSTVIIPSDAVQNPNGSDVDTIANNLKLLVLVNYSGDVTTSTKESVLLKQIVNNVDKTGTATDGFVMTNSAYKDASGNPVVMTQLYHKNLFDSPEVAKANPIDVYVERVVARTDVNFTANYEKRNMDQAWDNDKDNRLQLVPVIKGMAFYADPTETYLFKDASWNISGWSKDNDESLHRSFWAVTPPSAADTHFTFSYNTAIDSNHSFTDASTPTKKYIYENTLGGLNATKVVVAAQLYNKADVNEDGSLKAGAQPKDMACVYGQFTDKESAAVLVANTLKGLGYRIQVTNADNSKTIRTINYVATGDTDLEYSGVATKGDSYAVGDGDGNRTYLQLKELASGEAYVQEDGIDPETKNIKYKSLDKSVIENELKGRSAISYWNQGMCYYYTDINHINFTEDAETNNPGVVRNHVYKIQFTGISGYGTPVFDPDKIIIPTPPTYTDSGLVYLAARLNILKWRVVPTQSTVLGK